MWAIVTDDVKNNSDSHESYFCDLCMAWGTGHLGRTIHCIQQCPVQMGRPDASCAILSVGLWKGLEVFRTIKMLSILGANYYKEILFFKEL